MSIDEKTESGWAEETDWAEVEKSVEAFRRAGLSEEEIEEYRRNVGYDQVIRTYNKMRRFQIAATLLRAGYGREAVDYLRSRTVQQKGNPLNVISVNYRMIKDKWGLLERANKKDT